MMGNGSVPSQGAASSHAVPNNAGPSRGSPLATRAVSPDDVRDALQALKREELGDGDDALDFNDKEPLQSTGHMSSPPQQQQQSRYSMLAATPEPPPFRSERLLTANTIAQQMSTNEMLQVWQRMRDDVVVCCPCCFHVFPAAENRVHDASSP
jgi:hypothetical protein